MKKTCFVAMPFKETFDKVYKYAIKEAIEQAGYECLRADELACGGNILNNIVQNIKNSQFIIVDMTTHNPNVMYELGLAHAWEKKVLLLIEEDSDVPTDLSANFIVKYQDPNDSEYCHKLKNKIIKSIQSFEQGKTDFGNPVIDHAIRKEKAQVFENVKKSNEELSEKSQQSIKQHSKTDSFGKSSNISKDLKNSEPNQDNEQIKERKFEFKFVGQRQQGEDIVKH